MISFLRENKIFIATTVTTSKHHYTYQTKLLTQQDQQYLPLRHQTSSLSSLSASASCLAHKSTPNPLTQGLRGLIVEPGIIKTRIKAIRFYKTSNRYNWKFEKLTIYLSNHFRQISWLFNQLLFREHHMILYFNHMVMQNLSPLPNRQIY